MHYDPFDEVMRTDPLPVYAQLRAESPVHYVERLDAWALSLFEDVWNTGQDNEHFDQPGPSFQDVDSDAEKPPVFEGDVTRRSIFSMNPPQHTQLRKAMASHFTPGSVKKFEPELRAMVRDLLAKTLPTGRMDVIADLAAQISVQVACKIIGLPTSDGPRLVQIVKRYFAREPGVPGMSPDALAAAMELHAYLIEATVARRKEAARDDVLGIMMSQHFDNGGPFDDEEMAGQLMTLVVGGTETLPKVFAGGVLQLARHPDQRAALVADLTKLPRAFQEIARYEMPTNFLTRKVRKDTEIRGQKVREGQGILLLYRSANRDANEFENPDTFDITRGAPRILSFGHGTHVCLGQHAAKLEARIMYEELLAALPEYEVREDEVVPARSEFVDGYLSLPIHFAPTELRASKASAN